MKLKSLLFFLMVGLFFNAETVFGSQVERKKRRSSKPTSSKLVQSRGASGINSTTSAQQKRAMAQRAAVINKTRSGGAAGGTMRRGQAQNQILTQGMDKNFGGVDNDYVMFWQVSKNVLAGKSKVIDQSCLSQWYPSEFTIYNITFYNAEQFMMYCKARFFGNYLIATKILETSDPDEIKKLGRQVDPFNPVKWAKVAPTFVEIGNIEKFRQNPLLKNYLMDTGNRVLVEASPYDKEWGIGLTSDDSRATDRSQWAGKNLLGKALEDTRGYLKANNNPNQPLFEFCGQFSGLIDYIDRSNS